jgi:hypothetical protein
MIPAWQVERSRRLHRICKSIAARRAKGQKFKRAVYWFARYYRNRTYRTEPGRPARFTASSLRRWFYQWQKSGRTADALLLRYRSGRPKLSHEVTKRFIRAALLPNTTSFREAHGRMLPPIGSPSAFSHALGIREGKLVVKLFFLRRWVRRTERKLGNLLRKGAE